MIRENLSPDCFKGNLDRSTITEDWNIATTSPNSPIAIRHEGDKPPLHTIINRLVPSSKIKPNGGAIVLTSIYSYDFEQAAALSAPKKAFAFYSTADTDCWTRDANTAMLRRIWFRPRVMKDVSVVDTSSTILNIPVSLPLFICPTGVAKLINPEAEKGLARGAKSTGILEIVSFGVSKQIHLALIIIAFYCGKLSN